MYERYHLRNDNIPAVKKNTVWVRRPRKRKIMKSMLFPEIWELSPCAVNYKHDLVEFDELGILGSFGVSDE